MIKDKIPGYKRRLTKQERLLKKRELLNEQYKKYDLDCIGETIRDKANNRIRSLSLRGNSTDWSVPIVEPIEMLKWVSSRELYNEGICK